MALDKVLAEAAQETDGGRGGVEVSELVLVDAVPVCRSLKSAAGEREEQGTVDEQRDAVG